MSRFFRVYLTYFSQNYALFARLFVATDELDKVRRKLISNQMFKTRGGGGGVGGQRFFNND